VVHVTGTLEGPSTAGQGFISGQVSVNNGGKLAASSGATLTLRGGLGLASDTSSTFTLSGTPNGATGSPLIATGSGGATSLSVTATHTINLAAASTINVPNGMPYALYELYSYFGSPPSITSAISPFTGVFAPGTAPAGFNLGLFEGTSAATGAAATIVNNQVDAAVGAKPFVYLKSSDGSGSTSFNVAGNWSNGAAPSLANNYIVSVGLRSPTGNTSATFAGNSLTLGAGSSLGIKTTGDGTTTTVPTLVLNGGIVTNSQGSDGANYTDVLGGTNIFLTSTSVFDTLSGGVGTRNLTVAAPISGPGGLIINPTLVSVSTVTLTRANTYTGVTTVDAGTFQLGPGGSLASTAVLTLGSGTTSASFVLGDPTTTVNQTLASLTTVGSGSANSVVGGSNKISTLTINNSGPDTFSGLLGGTGTNQNNLALVMSGSGTLTLAGANTYTGGTIINGAGTLKLANSGPGSLGADTGPLTMTSGFFDMNGRDSVVVGNFTGSGGTVLDNNIGGSILTIGSGNATGGNFAGVIANNNQAGAGGVSVTKTGSGTITLSGLNSYTGTTGVNGGTLALAVPGGLGNTAIFVSATASLSVRPGGGAISAGSTSIQSAGATITLNPGGGAVNGGTFDMLDGAIGSFRLNQGANVPIGLTLGTSGPLNPPVLAFEIGDNGTTTSADQLFVTNGVSVGTGTGALISITGIGTNPLHTGIYPLITAGSFANADRFSLATPAIAVGNNQYNLSLSNTGTVENLIVSFGGPVATYWSGAQNASWNALTPGGGTNWLDGPAGMDAFALPSSGTNVFFTANNATHLATTLGADFTINSLTFTGTGTSATSPVSISGNTLTINASAANGNSAGSGIVVQSGSGAHSIASNITLSASQIWTNNSTNPLTVSGSIGDGGHNFGLTIGGSGSIVLSGNNSFGGTTVSNGALVTTATGTIGSGPLTINADLTPSTVTLGHSQTIGTLSGAVSNGGTARINLAGGVTLIVNQSADAAFPGTISLGTGAWFVKAGGSTLEIGRVPTLAANSSISVAEGTLRFAAGAGTPSIASGVTATISGAATLELAGTVSSLGAAVASERVHIANDSTAAAGLLVTGANQQVGAIDGAGRTQVNAGSDLTANHIVQAALIIGGDATHPALVTIAASDANGGPLDTPLGGPLASSSAVAAAGSAMILASFDSGTISASMRNVPLGLSSSASQAGSAIHAGGETEVPEPSTLLLLAIGVAVSFSIRVRRRARGLR
jgi:autotransporter-associated beta strand protein